MHWLFFSYNRICLAFKSPLSQNCCTFKKSLNNVWSATFKKPANLRLHHHHHFEKKTLRNWAARFSMESPLVTVTLLKVLGKVFLCFLLANIWIFFWWSTYKSWHIVQKTAPIILTLKGFHSSLMQTYSSCKYFFEKNRTFFDRFRALFH